MRIYHYTNIETLALILKNKTIRFNRLDQVDDLEEGKAESLGVQFCKYVFVSCWTDVVEESIPLWKMYGGDSGGIRISLEQEMFKEYLAKDLDFKNGTSTIGSITIKIPPEDLTNPEYLILPILDYDNPLFYRKIEYVKDISEYVKDAIQNNKDGYKIEMMRFGYYKNKRWQFQNEVRFVLYIFPYNILQNGADPNASMRLMHSFFQNKPLPFHYYDMHLKDDALDNMEITLSPSITEAQKIIVQTLIDKYAPKATIKDSTLGNIVRLK